MLKKLLPYITCIFFAFQMNVAFGQYTILGSSTETAFSSSGLTTKFLVCTQDTLKYEIKTSPANGSDVFTFKLPDGIIFNSLLWDSNTTSVTYILSADTMPKFSITWTGNFAIRLLVNAPSCKAQKTTNNVTKLWGNSSTDTIYFRHDSLSILNPVLKITDVSFPTGMVQSVGNIAEFTYRIDNSTVNGSKITGINFIPTPNSNIQYLGAYYITRVDSVQHRYYNGYSYNLLPHTNEYPMAASAINTIDSNMLRAATDTAYLDGSHPIYIHLPFTTTNCAVASNGETKFTIGCGSTDCDSVTLSASVTTNDAVAPALHAVVETPFDNATFCEAVHKDSSLIGFTCMNTAANSPDTGYARADSMRLYLYCIANVGKIDPYSIKINGYSVWNPAYDVQYSSHGYNMYLIDLTKYPAGPDGRPFGNNTLRDWDSSGHPDQLAEGQSFKISAYFIYDTLTCPSFPFANSGANFYLPAFAVTYNNQCFTLPALPRIASTDSLGGYNPLSVYEYSYTARPCTDTVPTDVSSSNNPFNVILCPNFGESFSPNGFDFYCPNGYYQLSVKMPAGYHLYNHSALWRDSTGTLNALHSKTYSYNPLYIATNECTHRADTLNPNILADSLNPPLYTENFYDSTVTVYFGNIMPPGCNIADFLPCVNIPIELDCSQVPLHSNRYNSFNYTLNYICDSNCASCGNTVLTKDSFVTYNHCDVGCGSVVPYTNAGWSFLRTNLGWINQNILAHNYYSICSSGINFSPADTLIDTALANHFAEYPGDQIEANVTGGYSGLLDSIYQNKYLQIAYIPFCSHYVYELDSAKQSTFVITGCTGVRGLNGLKLVLPPYPASVTDRGGVGSPVEMNFSIDSAIKNTDILKYDSLLKDPNLENLSITADIHLRVLNGNSLIYYPFGRNLVNLRTEFMCVNQTPIIPPLSGDTNPSCDAWGNTAYLYQPGTAFATNYDLTTTSNCTLFPFSCRMECSGALDFYHLDDFDYEFRPYVMLDSKVTFIIPSGYTYKYATFSAYMDNYTSNNTQNNFRPGDSLVYFPITPYYHSNTLPDTVVFKGLNNSCWPLIDQKYNLAGGQQYDLTIYSQPACNAPSPSKFYFYSGCTVGTQQSDPYFQYHYVMPKPDSVIVTHLSPIVHLDLPPTVNDSSNTITFKFILCDTGYFSGVGDGWLAIQNIGADSLLINSATLTNVHTHVSYTGIPYTDSTKGVLFNVDSLGLGKCDTLLLTATINPNSQSCPSPVGVGTGYLNVIYGYVCSGAITRPDSACEDRIDSFKYNVFPTTLELSLEGQSPDTVNLCGGQLIENLNIVSANYGTISDPMFWMKLPSGVFFDSLTFEYPCPGGKDTTLYISDTTNITGLLGGNPIGWKLDKDLRIHGLHGASVPNTINAINQVCVTVYLNMDCHYRNADSIKFFATGYTTCSILDSAKQSLQPKVDSNCFTVSITSNSPVCNGGLGTATTHVSGGDSPYTYDWSNGETTQTATGLSAGTYTVVVKDTNGCRGTASVIIKIDSISLTLSAAPILCFNDTTGINTTISGGVAPFLYLWSNGSTAYRLSGITSGTYSVIVTDQNGCNATASISLTQPTQLTVITAADSNVRCFGGSNAAATANASGGTSPYVYSWLPSGGTNAIATGLSAGIYTITVTDFNGCTVKDSVTITQPAQLNVTAIADSNVRCNGGSNAAATVTVSGGTTPYTYLWSPTGGTNATVTGLGAGTYTITLTDFNDCTVTDSVTITQPTLLTINTIADSNVRCNGGTNAAATVSASGGISPYTYLWSPSGETNATATGLSAGTYTIAVTDNNGCTAIDSITITQPLPLADSIQVDSNVSCNNGSNGQATGYTYGGISPYTYLWNPGGQTTATISGLPAGTYTLTITDSNGCVKIDSVIITQPLALTDSMIVISNINCNSGTLASASTNVSGGTAPYTYAWSPTSQTGDTAKGLSAGTYAVTITDNNGCSIIDSVTIQSLSLSLKDDTVSCGNDTGYAIVNCGGGTPPYTYLWSNGNTTAIVNGLTAGSYTVVVTDSLGCQVTDSLTVTGCPQCYMRGRYDLTINNVDSRSLTSLHGYVACEDILVIGTFTVDSNFTFDDCNVAFAPGAMINVIKNSTLTVTNVSSCRNGLGCPHLYAACDTMWRGIFVYPGSMVQMFKTGLVEDADSAIVSINSGTAQGIYRLFTYVFNRNYKDIVVRPFNGTFAGVSSGCVYTCRDLDTLPACNALTEYYSAAYDTIIMPFINKRTQMGWDIDSVNSFSDFGENTFDNMVRGIYARKTNLTVCTDTFRHINPKSDTLAAIYDKGSLILGGNKLVVGGAGGNGNTFEDCTTGVYAQSNFQYLYVSDNIFHDKIPPSHGAPITIGVLTKGPMMPFFRGLVDSNIIDSARFGAVGSLNTFGKFQIEYNRILGGGRCVPNQEQGIRLQEMTSSSIKYNVEYNSIDNMHYGIYANGLNYPIIYKDTIAIGGDMACMLPLSGKGIFLSNSLNASIVDNTVSLPFHINPNDYVGKHFYGIYAEDSKNAQILCNTTFYLDTAIACNGVGDIGSSGHPFELLGNHMTAGPNTLNSTGIEIAGGAAIGLQGSVSVTSDNEWMDTTNFTCRSRVPLPSIPFLSRFFVWGGSVYNPDAGSCAPYIDTLPPDTSAIHYNCSSVPPSISGSAIIDSVATNKMTYLQSPDTSSRISKSALTTILWNNDSLLGTPLFHHFNDSISGVSLGQLMAVDTTLTSTSAYDATVLLSTVNGITPASNVEANIQATQQVYLQAKVANADTLTQSSLNALRNLANLCPNFDGYGVYQARALLDYYDTTFTIYDNDNCVNDDNRDKFVKNSHSGNSETVKNVQFNLYPNPNNGNFTIEYDLGKETSGRVEIYNQVGMKVAEYLLSSPKGKMNISNPNFSQSVYIYKLYSSSLVKKIGKIVIVK